MPDGYSNTIRSSPAARSPACCCPASRSRFPSTMPACNSHGILSTHRPLDPRRDPNYRHRPDRLEQTQIAAATPRRPAALGTGSLANLTAQLGRPMGNMSRHLTPMPPISAAWAKTSTTLQSSSTSCTAGQRQHLGRSNTRCPRSMHRCRCPAESLGFARDYQLAIGSRYAVGILGYGWSAAYQSRCRRMPMATIGARRRQWPATASFSPTPDGGYFSPDQDVTLTANPDGSYTLTE